MRTKKPKVILMVDSDLLQVFEICSLKWKLTSLPGLGKIKVEWSESVHKSGCVHWDSTAGRRERDSRKHSGRQ